MAAADDASADVLGFYALSLAELVNSDLPANYQKRLPVKVPVFRLGRLATAKNHERKGIGEYILFDAIDRVTRIAKETFFPFSYICVNRRNLRTKCILQDKFMRLLKVGADETGSTGYRAGCIHIQVSAPCQALQT